MPPTTQERKIVEFGSAALAQLQQVAKTAGGGGTGRQPPPKKAEDASLANQMKSFLLRSERIAGGFAIGAAAGGAALARRGFSGTVDGARLDYAMEQLSRQLAAVFQPVIQAMTYMAGRTANAIRNMSGGEMDRLMGSALGTLVGFGLGGARGALLGGLAGPGVMERMTGGGPMGRGDALAATAAGAYLGYRVAGVPGALFGGAAAAIASGDTRVGSTAAGAAAGAAVGSFLPGVGTVAGGIIGGGVGFVSSLFAGDDDKKAEPPRVTVERAKREVLPFQSEMGAAGSTYWKFQEAAIRATAGTPDDAGPLKPIVDLLEMIVTLLGKAIGVRIDFSDPKTADEMRVGAVPFFGTAVGDMVAGILGGRR